MQMAWRQSRDGAGWLADAVGMEQEWYQDGMGIGMRMEWGWYEDGTGKSQDDMQMMGGWHGASPSPRPPLLPGATCCSWKL